MSQIPKSQIQNYYISEFVGELKWKPKYIIILKSKDCVEAEALFIRAIKMRLGFYEFKELPRRYKCFDVSILRNDNGDEILVLHRYSCGEGYRECYHYYEIAIPDKALMEKILGALSAVSDNYETIRVLFGTGGRTEVKAYELE